MPRNILTVTDHRTGKSYDLPVTDDTIRALELRQIKVSAEDFGLMSYDPGFANTACCRSQITFIDGEEGILLYRGYPIEQLADEYNVLEVAYLLFHGELPGEGEYREWRSRISSHTLIHKKLEQIIEAFHPDAGPMSVLMSAVAGLAAFYPDSRNVTDPKARRLQIHRLIAKVPTIAAFAYRHSRGFPYVYPEQDLSYTGNFLNMMFKMPGARYRIDPVLERAMDVLFILHADHEQNCSTSVMRSAGSSLPDPYSATAAAIAALSGPRHGGANEAVLRMLREIGSADRIAAYIERVKAGDFRLMGFGHRVYKNYDPRARLIKELARQVFAVTGTNPLLDVALGLERIALQDEYFVSRKLYPNVDFYSGLIYQAMGFPTAMFPVLFAVARTTGWLAQWEEMLQDSEQKIARPRQVYTGRPRRDVPSRKPASKSASLGG